MPFFRKMQKELEQKSNTESQNNQPLIEFLQLTATSKLPPIASFHDIDPMLGDESESSHRHLLALCDVTAQEFELFCGKKPGPENDDAVADDETDSEWEEAEFQDFMPRLHFI